MTDEFEILKDYSARIGGDLSLVQGAGGNTSIKGGGVMWIKASGTWLRDALRDEIMVPVALEPLRAALDRNDPAAEKAQDFVIGDQNPGGLRPSIETTLHAIFPDRIVVHVHCVETIAIAVRLDAQAVLAERLQGLNWAFAPYIRPGLPLARACAAVLEPGANILVLANHGLVVAGESVGDAAAVLADVCQRLAVPVRPAPPADPAALEALARDGDYGLPDDPATHGTATDPVSCAIAAGGSLYPDHVIFLGPASIVAASGEKAAEVEARVAAAGRPVPVSILFPGKGVLMHHSANAGAQAMARCLADVTARIPAGIDVRYFDQAQNGELLNWDAEKYRQTLTAERAGE